MFLYSLEKKESKRGFPPLKHPLPTVSSPRTLNLVLMVNGPSSIVHFIDRKRFPRYNKSGLLFCQSGCLIQREDYGYD